MNYDKKYINFLEEERTIKHRHQEELIEFNKRLQSFRNKCEHNWKYQPDASGNNDSSWYCDKCEEWTNYNPHKKIKSPIHKLNSDDLKLTLEELNKKYGGNGWEK